MILHVSDGKSCEEQVNNMLKHAKKQASNMLKK